MGDETARIARETKREPDPGGGDVQRGRTRGETARQAGGIGHGLLSLMAAREGIGHMLVHQAPSYTNNLLPTSLASELSTPNYFAEAFADEYSGLWIDAMRNDFMDLRARGPLEVYINQRA